MKKNPILSLALILAMLATVGLNTSCRSFKKPGTEVTGPFSGSRYQSNNRYFRATGMATSSDLNTSKTRAMVNAKTRLAGNISSTMRSVADEYTQEKGMSNSGEFMERFEVLSREVVNQTIVDLRTKGERSFQLENNRFQTYVALEIHKRSMYNHMRRLAEARRDWNDADRNAFFDFLDEMEKLVD